MLEARKRGDFAFRDKNFKGAIDCYSQVTQLFRAFFCTRVSYTTTIILHLDPNNSWWHEFCLFLQFINVGTMVSPTVFARRSLCYLLCDQPDAALRDAMQAQCVHPDWPTAFYMQSVALAKLDMQEDAVDMLNEAATLEERSQWGGRWSTITNSTSILLLFVAEATTICIVLLRLLLTYSLIVHVSWRGLVNSTNLNHVYEYDLLVSLLEPLLKHNSVDKSQTFWSQSNKGIIFKHFR